jgi:hypothetical protein
VPFTLSHPAVVLPLRRIGLPLSALVAGSMAPDLPMFLPGHRGYDRMHSPLGIVTYDVVIALGGLVGWFYLLRDPLADLTPYVRRRVPARGRLSRRGWAFAPLAAAIGAATHVGWDLGTHKGRWLTTHVALLHNDLGPMPGYKWAQFGSGVVGGAIVIGYAVARLRRQPVIDRPSVVRRPLVWFVLPPLGGLVLGLVAFARASSWEVRASDAAVTAIQAGGVLATVVALLWWLAPRPELRRTG